MKVKGSLQKQEAEIEASREEIATFFDGVVPDFVKEGGGILSDTIKYWRFKNAVKIVKKAKEIISESGLKKHEVPLKVLLPLIENSTLETDEHMQDKWINLLANAVAGDKNISPNFIEILKELSPIEVSLLDIIYNKVKDKTSDERKQIQFSKQKVCEAIGLSSEYADFMIENLYRLNLCQPPASHGGVAIGKYPIMLRTNDFFEFTTLGFNFVKACKSVK